MYDLAGSLDGAAFQSLCRTAFREMRRAGITAVGEFHYLRHEREGDFGLDERLAAAASQAGIRLVLLLAYYRWGSIGRPLEGAQRRFATESPAAYWRQWDRLAGRLDPALQTLGAAAHSLRGATPEEVAELHAEARRRRLVFHLHVEEQRREVEECLAGHGARPMAILLDRLQVDAALTAVHCTYSAPADLARFARAGGNVCLCPTTEANLGDGIPDLSPLAGVGGSLCLGTDSNARISMLEEMRWLEYGQRLARQERGMLRDGRGEVAPALLQAATLGGARALGLPAGEIAPGRWADFAAIDLEAPGLAGADAASLPAALAFGCAEEAVAATCVGGRWEAYR
jgi:formiminoglutamate deiminase